MLAYLKGKILYKNQNFVVIDVNDVGYKVFVGPEFYADLKLGTESEIYIHYHQREDAVNLYGFKGIEELGLFELLLSVSGVGPKSAMGIIAIASPEELQAAIAAGDSSLLTKVSGIGGKTAERIVLELRGKVSKLVSGQRLNESGMSASSDEIDALMTLGYSLPQAREALKSVDSGIKDPGERIREALRRIGK